VVSKIEFLLRIETKDFVAGAIGKESTITQTASILREIKNKKISEAIEHLIDKYYSRILNVSFWRYLEKNVSNTSVE